MNQTLLLLSTLALAAACGGAQTPPENPSTPPTQSGTATAPASPTASGSSATAPPTTNDPGAVTAPPTAPTTAAPTGPMRPIAPTEMAAQLKELGLDVKNLPPLNKIPPDKIRKVMGTFTKALGTQCTGCHDGDDFKKATPNKKVASRMWNEWVRGNTLAGGAVYCDSCHGGKTTFLVRDPGGKELSKWMDDNFVGKMKKTNGQAYSCETCHGDPMEGKFLASWRSARN